MCGIVGVAAERDIAPLLLDGLRRLEYRGYDSAGLALLDNGGLKRLRRPGEVARLVEEFERQPLEGEVGIAHTRWATHGAPTEQNAHPMFAGERVAVAHNGIVENYEAIKEELTTGGVVFSSETDTECIAHLIDAELSAGKDLATAARDALARLKGSYSVVVLAAAEPDAILAAHRGAPMVVGLGESENYAASDIAALLPVTRRYRFLRDGDLALLTRGSVEITGAGGEAVERPMVESEFGPESVERGAYRHYMQKEIFEQARAVRDTLLPLISGGLPDASMFGPEVGAKLGEITAVHIAACGSAFNAGLVARQWIQDYAKLPCTVEIASEYRYRPPPCPPNCLFLAISQSGETADTLAATRAARERGYRAVLALSNVATSSLVRNVEHSLLTRAGLEVGVASTKALLTQLAALAMMALALARARGSREEEIRSLTQEAAALPGLIEQLLEMDGRLAELAGNFRGREHVLFLGRGPMWPVAMEGALKLKELSYIHAEAYAAGELKHGPLALVDDRMMIVALAPNDGLLHKLRSNLEEVRARGGQLFVVSDPDANLGHEDGMIALRLPAPPTALQAPVLYTVPLQLLAYHVAVQKGHDVDRPRNLAKSVTVD
ncbi:MAG: glutamine--fructose-6-phosphate transaminase (isomerizing) [Gammaproteobacteria bacterium]|nr:glutamine--fructose-6-phosphate transaminase (isomerizing) [Gammaproteobacteria bacterium]MYD01486.1 glutamine--fructose-6-phosphate transaminase (isomerizing) [Gammaproteobacteria bacterium]MYI26146.1 glutamine--fructose-6-phosphate transaminase (isomerizing) [Gammaproteobacteria bacterium]